jgi:minor extracellular protease Epr
VFIEVAVENGARAIEREWLIMLNDGDLDLLQKRSIDILEQTPYPSIGLTLLRFRVDAALDSKAKLKAVLPDRLMQQLDRNHIYATQSTKYRNGTKAEKPQDSSICLTPLKIGMIDTALSKPHKAFKKSQIIEKNFLQHDLPLPKTHGTAVASLLVGTVENSAPLLPAATLYSASVFYAQNEYSQGTTLSNLLAALNWLVSQNVLVINMSLSGPENHILKKTIDRVVSSGTAIVAAAGNQGPAAPALYPAAYENVITATAVDQKYKVYAWANQGDHIDFAASGVSILTANSEGEYDRQSGTSMAVPVVTAFIACHRQDKNLSINKTVSKLAGMVIDLGAPGRDPVFGYGLLRKY